MIDLNIRDLTAALVLCLAAEGRSPRRVEWYQGKLGKFVEYLDHPHGHERIADVTRWAGTTSPSRGSPVGTCAIDEFGTATQVAASHE